jgi:hypothetical protein
VVAQAEHSIEQPPVQAVSIPEAAHALGVSLITIRRRIKRGELRGQRLKTPQGFEWRVILPVQVAEGDDDGATQETPSVNQAADQAPTQRREQATDQRLIEALQAHNATLQAEVAGLQTELDARRREVQALLTLLAQSQQRLITMSTNQSASGKDDEQAPDARATPHAEYAAPEQGNRSDQPISRWSRVVAWLRGA